MKGKRLLGIFFKCMYEQAINPREFDPIESCRICEYGKDCTLSHREKMKDELKAGDGEL